LAKSHRETNRAIPLSSVLHDVHGHDNVFGNKALMPPRRQAHLSRTQLRLRRLRREDFRRCCNEAVAHLQAAAELLATRGPRRSLRIEWLWYNAPALAAGHAPWYRLACLGRKNTTNRVFCLTATGSSWVTTGTHRRTPIIKEPTGVPRH
jgi:hypothetical protein